MISEWCESYVTSATCGKVWNTNYTNKKSHFTFEQVHLIRFGLLWLEIMISVWAVIRNWFVLHEINLHTTVKCSWKCSTYYINHHNKFEADEKQPAPVIFIWPLLQMHLEFLLCFISSFLFHWEWFLFMSRKEHEFYWYASR